jgi:hypothetical protein
VNGGDFIVSGTDTATASVPASGAGTRMFFDVQDSAFRAGAVNGTQWDNASTGQYSVAMGWNNTSSYSGTVALGGENTSSGNFTTAIGYGNTASGTGGTGATAIGWGNSALGDGSLALGALNQANNHTGYAIGTGNVSWGDSLAMGFYSQSSGSKSVSIGLGWPTTAPLTSGAESLGIYMGAQESVTFAATHTMGLFGGKMVIDPAIPATQLTARGVIDVGAATDAIVLPTGTTAQQPGSPVNGMIRYNTTTGKFEGRQAGAWVNIIGGSPAGADTQVQFNDGGAFGGDTALVWNKTSNYLGIGVTPSVALDVSGDVEYTGTITDVSDIRLKKDIHPLRDRGSMLDKLGQLDTYSFTMKNDPKEQVEFGVMAQEVQKIFPELVRTDMSTPEHYMSVNYIGMIAPLIEAGKELRAENDDLKTRLASLEQDMKGMKAQTGYGIEKASVQLWMIVLASALFGASSMIFLIGGILRSRREEDR